MKKLVLLIGISLLNAAEIRVDLTQAGRKVSPHLFGLFLEEINHAGDGGLYERYIGCKQRLRNAVNDRIGLEPQDS